MDTYLHSESNAIAVLHVKSVCSCVILMVKTKGYFEKDQN